MEILSGVFEGKTLGTPVCLLILNKGQQSHRYDHLRDVFRPGHAEATYYQKYGIYDHRGGGRASARETAARVAAGAVAKQILLEQGIEVIGYTRKVGPIEAETFDLREIEKNAVRCPDPVQAKKMADLIRQVRDEDDSIGGVVEVIARGVPAGLGEPVYDKMDADLAKGLMSINAIKGVEIGAGLGAAGMRGSENNDPWIFEDGRLRTKTNHAGGIIGGITTGEDLVVRIAVKPPSTIGIPQQTVDRTGQNRDRNPGRHRSQKTARSLHMSESGPGRRGHGRHRSGRPFSAAASLEGSRTRRRIDPPRAPKRDRRKESEASIRNCTKTASSPSPLAFAKASRENGNRDFINGSEGSRSFLGGFATETASQETE